jgi:hypothetical protein
MHKIIKHQNFDESDHATTVPTNQTNKCKSPTVIPGALRFLFLQNKFSSKNVRAKLRNTAHRLQKCLQLFKNVLKTSPTNRAGNILVNQ